MYHRPLSVFLGAIACHEIHLLGIIFFTDLNLCVCRDHGAAVLPGGLISRSLSDFTLKLYKEVSLHRDNLLLSPLSVYISLCMVMVGGKGFTLEQMKEVLSVDRMEDTLSEFPALKDHLNSLNTFNEMKIANKVFLNDGLAVLKEYAHILRRTFDAKYDRVTFLSNPLLARNSVNNWVSLATNRTINEIESRLFDVATRLITVSAAYFKGFWPHQFPKPLVQTRQFHISYTSSVPVQMMCQETVAGFVYDGELKAKVIDLPYDRNMFSMVIILPEDVQGISHVEQQLDSRKLSKILYSVKRKQQRMKVYLPKFKMKNTFCLRRFLYDLGLVNAFHSEKADFGGIVYETNLHIQHVLHKAYIDVSEDGVKYMDYPSGGHDDLLLFVADHPFVFLVVENARNLITFIGALKMPMNCEQ